VTVAGAGRSVPAGPPADTNQHYDLDPEIFGLFLDPLRKYSSGRYRSPEDTLEQAQVRKLRFVADRLGLRGGERLLDVGCGWGSLALFVAREHRCQVVGLSPSPRQVDFVNARAKELGVEDRVRVQLGHFETAADLGAGKFDAITMLGSIVHMPDLAGVYRRCRDLLRRSGALYVSESCFRNAAMRERFGSREGSLFVRDDTFGWGDLRPLSDLVRAAEDAGLSITGVDDLTDDYRRTIDAWLANVRANSAAIDAIQQGTAAALVRYLEVANAGWGRTTKHYALVCRRGR
jgi:cyclopropane-fatty-acyl-phospholipid synthase